ncbi:MAG: hypothetical protein AAF456_09720 [Planctomycetota bacterium]
MTSERMRSWRPHRRSRIPLGIVSAILTACIVTLIGVASGFEPFVILKRALIASVMLGMFVSTGANIVRMANHEYSGKSKKADSGANR